MSPWVLPLLVTYQVSPLGLSGEEPVVAVGRGQEQDAAGSPSSSPGDRDSHPEALRDPALGVTML